MLARRNAFRRAHVCLLVFLVPECIYLLPALHLLTLLRALTRARRSPPPAASWNELRGKFLHHERDGLLDLPPHHSGPRLDLFDDPGDLKVLFASTTLRRECSRFPWNIGEIGRIGVPGKKITKKIERTKPASPPPLPGTRCDPRIAAYFSTPTSRYSMRSPNCSLLLHPHFPVLDAILELHPTSPPPLPGTRCDPRIAHPPDTRSWEFRRCGPRKSPLARGSPAPHRQFGGPWEANRFHVVSGAESLLDTSGGAAGGAQYYIRRYEDVRW